MNLKKSIISIILACVLCVMGISYPTNAASAKGMIIGSSVSGQPGDTVDVIVSLWSNPGITSMVLNVDYNSDVLELVKIQDAQLLSEHAIMTTSPDVTMNPYRVIWMIGTSDSTSNGKLATLTFKIKDTAVEGKYGVTITFDEEDIYNTALENVEFGVINAGVIVEKNEESENPDLGNTEMPSVTTKPDNTTKPPVTAEPEELQRPECFLGDMNHDGNIELPDAQMALKIALKIIPADTDTIKCGDINGNNRIDLSDAQTILKEALKITNSFK